MVERNRTGKEHLRAVGPDFKPTKPKRLYGKRIATGVVLTGLLFGGRYTINRRVDCVPLPKNPNASSAQYKSDFWCTTLNNVPEAIYTSDIPLYRKK